eukprot:TRINITY_DN56371_c0_g1_i1.p1 TRINITY_DN56371_c0_g1~~TRINITY_DN56371_c0_g1_i1.p1  ORF type:complete len:168 (+),score=38.60 TRINITY_DN56371_c0_g1_i1:87-590(+)
MLRVLASILHLGNINIIEKRKKMFNTMTGERIADVIEGIIVDDSKDLEATKRAAKILQIKAEDLTDALTHRSVTVRAVGTHKVALTFEQSVDARDALAKALYEKLFEWLVATINNALNVRALIPEKTTTIGVLDIFGFEDLETNSLEQIGRAVQQECRDRSRMPSSA